jgi:hypothetical protein
MTIAVKSSDALYDVPRIKFMIFFSDPELLALESRPAFHFTVDNLIQLIDSSK